MIQVKWREEIHCGASGIGAPQPGWEPSQATPPSTLATSEAAAGTGGRSPAIPLPAERGAAALRQLRRVIAHAGPAPVGIANDGAAEPVGIGAACRPGGFARAAP